MKLILNGGGDGKAAESARQLLNSVINHSRKILYIPLAWPDPTYRGCLEFMTDELSDVEKAGIEMIRSTEELMSRDFSEYAALYIGGGNTYKLLHDLNASGASENIRRFIERDGVVFGGSAGAIIFGKSLDACAPDDENIYGELSPGGFDVLDGISLFCHYGSHTEQENKQREVFLKELSLREKIIALPEEDTIFINGDKTEIIGTRPYFIFDKGTRQGYQPGEYVFTQRTDS